MRENSSKLQDKKDEKMMEILRKKAGPLVEVTAKTTAKPAIDLAAVHKEEVRKLLLENLIDLTFVFFFFFFCSRLLICKTKTFFLLVIARREMRRKRCTSS